MSRINSILMLSIMILLSGTMGTYGQDPKAGDYKKDAFAWVAENKEDLNRVAKNIWDFAETALKEHKSAAALSGLIEKNGFTVERGVAGMPTAFVATYGRGKPVIGILGEYDALPGLSQKVFTPRKEALVEGQPGHGCGHNVFGVASAAAAIAMKEVMEKHGVGGTVKFYGCPAEETVVGKVYMAKEGLFDDLDICFDWHPGSSNQVSLNTSNALNNFEVTFHGKTAHAAGDPWDGRSALDAVELMNIGVNYLREHVQPTVRIHYVIPDAGRAPNIVPDYAKVWYYVRGKNRQEVEEVYARVLEIAKGAALMSDTRHEVYLITGVYNKLVNREIARVLHENLTLVGAPNFSDEEQKFAREMQEYLGKKPEGMSTEIKPLEEPKGFMGGGSTDVADVSWITPTASLSVACWPLESPGHSWAVVTCSGSSIGFKGLETAAKTIAAAGIDSLLNPQIIEAAQKEFQKETEGFTYKSAVPKNQKARLP